MNTKMLKNEIGIRKALDQVLWIKKTAKKRKKERHKCCSQQMEHTVKHSQKVIWKVGVDKDQENLQGMQI